MRKLGISDQEIQQTFEIGERQVQRLLQLTDLPPNLSQAVATSQIKSTLALRLMQHARKHPSTDIDYWLNWIIANNASVSSLSAALRKHLSKAPRPPLATYTSNSARIRSTRIDHNLSPAQRKNLLKQLHTLINFINNL
jgi:hypothetical protein